MHTVQVCEVFQATTKPIHSARVPQDANRGRKVHAAMRVCPPHSSFRCAILRTKSSVHPLVLSPLQQCHAMHGHGTAWRALHSGSDEQHGRGATPGGGGPRVGARMGGRGLAPRAVHARSGDDGQGGSVRQSGSGASTERRAEAEQGGSTPGDTGWRGVHRGDSKAREHARLQGVGQPWMPGKTTTGRRRSPQATLRHTASASGYGVRGERGTACKARIDVLNTILVTLQSS